MKTIKKVFFIMACLLLTIAAKAQEENDVQKRERVEKSTKPFNPSYFSISENSFYILETTIVNNQIVIDSTATISVVPGKLPYPSGNFKVAVMDKQGKQITEYFMQDPLYVYSCEGENNHVGSLKNGRVFISLPKNDSIGKLIFSRDKERIGTVDIGDLIVKTQRDPTKGQE